MKFFFNSNYPSLDPNDDSPKEVPSDQKALEFMACVAKVIFQIAYCFASTKETCYKEGNSLMFAICAAHPKLIGTVLEEIDSNLEKIGKRALYLAGELPFSKWLPHIDCKKVMKNFIFCQNPQKYVFGPPNYKPQ